MYSPSDFPEPDKSKQNTVMLAGSKVGIADKASILELQLPCKYITHGRC